MECLVNLNYLLVGGEVANVNLLQKLQEYKVTCINHYGPTETTIGCIINQHFTFNTNYLGKALYNTKLYILDNNHNPLPIGAIGEFGLLPIFRTRI